MRKITIEIGWVYPKGEEKEVQFQDPNLKPFQETIKDFEDDKEGEPNLLLVRIIQAKNLKVSDRDQYLSSKTSKPDEALFLPLSDTNALTQQIIQAPKDSNPKLRSWMEAGRAVSQIPVSKFVSTANPLSSLSPRAGRPKQSRQ